MNAMRSVASARSAAALFRCRLISRSDVKGAQHPGRNQNRALMRGGRT